MKGLLAALRAQMDEVVASNNDLQSQVAALRDQVEQCQVSVPAVPGVGAQPQTHVRKIIRPSSAASSHDDRDDCIASGRHTNAFCHPTVKGDFRRNKATALQSFIAHLENCYVNEDITDAVCKKCENDEEFAFDWHTGGKWNWNATCQIACEKCHMKACFPHQGIPAKQDLEPDMKVVRRMQAQLVASFIELKGLSTEETGQCTVMRMKPDEDDKSDMEV